MAEVKYPGHKNLITTEDNLLKYNNYISQLIVNKIKSHMYLNSHIRILDFGAGIGTISYLVAQKLKVSIDCFELDSYQKEIISKKSNLNLVNSIKKNYYDVIFSSNVLEHIEDDKKQVDTLSKSIKANGILITYLPAFNCLWSKMDDHVGHYRRYNRKKIYNLLNSNFVILENNYVDFVGFFLTLIFKFSSNSKKPSAFSLKIFDNFLLPVSIFFDYFFSKFIGKNIFTVAKKREI